jgi:hypothetical protein
MAGKKRKAYSALARASQERQKRSAALVKVECVFQGIAPMSERGEAGPRTGSPHSGPRWPFGTPSAGLTLNGLLASRARLRFTRRTEITFNKPAGQGQGTVEWIPGSRSRMESGAAHRKDGSEAESRSGWRDGSPPLLSNRSGPLQPGQP